MQVGLVNQTSRGGLAKTKGIFTLLAISFLALVLGGCASTTKKQTEGPIFYPPLPNPPRIQYLKTFSTERDLGANSSFSDFILGQDAGGETLINKPYGVAVANGKIFVVDTRGPGYVIFDLKTKRVKTVYGAGPGRMKKPINITIDKAGNRYVSDTGLGQVLEFDKQDKFIRAFGRINQFKPTDMAIRGDNMYVVDIANHKIHVLSLLDGHTIKIIGKVGSKAGEFFQPTNIAIGPDGYLYVGDTGNFRVQTISQDGKFVKSFGHVGSGLGQFARPKGVSVDHEGRLYVVDAAFANVQVFDQLGRLLMFFGGPGPHSDNLLLPTDITIDYDNVGLFQQYAAPNFKLEYVILVTNQFGRNKANVYGFGKMLGMDYGRGVSQQQ
jgi:DNA-binding beta-propeller fold protein YncE